MFLNVDQPDRNKVAIKDDSGYQLTYGDVCRTIEEFASLGLQRSVIFCLCENCAGALVGYLALKTTYRCRCCSAPNWTGN